VVLLKLALLAVPLEVTPHMQAGRLGGLALTLVWGL
jgi:hypothetical protein